MSQLCYLAGAMALPLGLLLRLCTKSSVTPSSRPQRETVIITGGCSGLGLEIASIYLKANAQVAVLDVVDEAAPKLSEFPSMRYYKCDVSKEKQVKDTMDNIEDEVSKSQPKSVETTGRH